MPFFCPPCSICLLCKVRRSSGNGRLAFFFFFFVLFICFHVCSFAEDVIHIYYESDEVVCEDVELQAFVKDIYVYGMRGVKTSGKV